MASWATIESKVNDFVKNNPKFKEIVEECFAQADVTDVGTLNPLEASACTEVIFVKLQEPLEDYGCCRQQTMMTTSDLHHPSSVYGFGMLGGIVAVFLVKRALRAVPVVNWATALFPTLLVGPVLGVAAIYGWEKGNILALKNKLFPPKAVQFKKA